nr:reverse transcriptase domain-containing protein [Tanacetum cinerariifolium]
MSTRSSFRNLFPPLDNPKLTIRRRSRSDPTLLNNSEMAAEGNNDLPIPELRTMEELCRPSFNGRGDDDNKHLDKFLHVTQSIKVNGVTDDTLHLYLFPHSLTHHATAWFDRLLRNSINTFEQMAKMFLGKYFPPSMVTKLRNEITNFRQRPDESLFEAWERYKLSIDRCPNHIMLHITQIYMFYNGLTLRHRDTINVAAGGTFMKRCLEECYDLIENMTAHHNDWDTSAQRSELSSSITSSFDTEIAALKAKMAEINKNLMRVLQVNQQVKAVNLNCETCGGPHSFSDFPATVGNTQNVYAAGAYQGNSYQPQGNRNLPSYRNQGNHNHQGNNQGRNQFFHEANKGQNQPPAYQAPAYQAPVYQALVHQPQIPQPQVVTTNEITNFMKANDAILKNMQTNMTSLTNLNLELKNMFGQFMKMNTTSSSGSRTLPGNTITNPKEDLKGITTGSGTTYQGPTIPTTSSSPVVERETEVTKDTVHPTNNGSTKDVQPPVVLTESLILNSRPVISPIIEPVASPFGPSIKSLLTNKVKLYELARTPLNEHCSAVLLKKFLEKLDDPVMFLIPCDFLRMAECLALADLGASINLMPLSMWNKLSLPDLSPRCMTLELADRLISCPVRVAEDVFVKVGAARSSSTNYINTASITVNTASTPVNNASIPVNTASPSRNDIYEVPNDGIFTSASYDDEGAVADFTNLESTINVGPIPKSRIHYIYPSTQILGDPTSAVQPRSQVNKSSGAHAFKISQALEEESWVDAMQEELPKFKTRQVWILVDLRFGKKMDVKSAFLYGKIDEEVYVSQPLRFIDPKFPKKVYKVIKALYSLHQAPKVWYATLSTFLVQNGCRRGLIDKTLFIEKDKKDIMLVQVYIDDIIFGSTKKSWCDEFEALMKSKFQMSSMGELTFFLGLRVKQKEYEIFISRDIYVAEIMKKFDFMSVKTASTLIETKRPLVKDAEVADVDAHLYRSMNGSLVYLTGSRPDNMYAVYAYSRF